MGHHQAVPSLVECVDVLEVEIVHPRQQISTIRHLRWHGFAYSTVATHQDLWERTVGVNNDSTEMQTVRQHIGRYSVAVMTSGTSLLQALHSSPACTESFSLEHMYDRRYDRSHEIAADYYQRKLFQIRAELLISGIEMIAAAEYVAAIPDIPAEYADKYQQI